MYQELTDEGRRVEDGLCPPASMPTWLSKELEPGQELPSIAPLDLLAGPEPSSNLVDRTMQRIQDAIAARRDGPDAPAVQK